MQDPPNLVGSVVSRLSARGLRLSRLQELHPAIDLAVRTARRKMYTRAFFREGPRRRGTRDGITVVIFNHCYDLDIDALCAASGPHTIWVLDAFALFTDVHHYFPDGQRDLQCTYGEGPMRESIARFKRAYVTELAQRLVRETGLDVLLTPADTHYYLRPLIEELEALGVTTVVQDKEGTIAPSPMMDDHARLLAKRYPPMAQEYYLWSELHRDLWRRVGLAEDRMKILGQPRSDFFFHRDRWPSKASLGLTEGKRLVVVFTYDADAYLRVTEPIEGRPWKQMRDDLHEAVRALARERDDLEVVVKAHPQQHELAEIVEEFAAHPVPNVKVMTGAKSANHLIVHADAIVGFQSTVMIEAMLTTKPVIYAGWGAHHDLVSDNLIPIHRSGGCTLVGGRAELERALRGALDGTLAPSPDVMRARKAFTDRYFYDADGRCAERVLTATADLVRRAV